MQLQVKKKKKPTKKVRVELIHIINNIIAFRTSVAVFQALADTLKTVGDRNKGTALKKMKCYKQSGQKH